MLSSIGSFDNVVQAPKSKLNMLACVEDCHVFGLDKLFDKKFTNDCLMLARLKNVAKCWPDVGQSLAERSTKCKKFDNFGYDIHNSLRKKRWQEKRLHVHRMCSRVRPAPAPSRGGCPAARPEACGGAAGRSRPASPCCGRAPHSSKLLDGTFRYTG